MLSDIESMGFDGNFIQLDINQENESEKEYVQIFFKFCNRKKILNYMHCILIHCYDVQDL
jgi:hypothetical protein